MKTTKASLIEQLKSLGAKVSGNKPELEKRLKTWTENALNGTLFKVTPVASDVKFTFPNVKYEPLEKLSIEIIQWISQTLIDIYFMERKAQKGNSQGRRLFMCDFVKNCCFYKDENDVYFRAICSAELKKTVDYEVKLHVHVREYTLMKAECPCPAGIGPGAACKHVSAVLYAIEYFGVTGKVKQNASCTSSLQKWHKPTSTGRNLVRTSVNEMLNIVTPIIHPCEEVTAFFYKAFSQAKCESPLVRKKHCNMTAYLNDHNYCKEDVGTMILNSLNAVTTAEITRFEKLTRKNTNLWLKLRKSRITASIAHDVIRTCRSKRYATSFLKQHFSNKSITPKALKWGIVNESTALKQYCTIMGNNFNKCGITIDKRRNYISATPDAVNLANDTIVEIKCPYSVRHSKPEMVDYLKDGYLKSTHRYYTQMQVQMHVTQIYRCDLVVWTPQGIFIQNFKYNPELVSIFLRDIDFYYKNVFTPMYFDSNCSQ